MGSESNVTANFAAAPDFCGKRQRGESLAGINSMVEMECAAILCFPFGLPSLAPCLSPYFLSLIFWRRKRPGGLAFQSKDNHLKGSEHAIKI